MRSCSISLIYVLVLGMHEMRRSETVQHHPHRHVDGRKEAFSVHKLSQKDRHRGSSHVNKDHKNAKTQGASSQIPVKIPIKICGDWSEHLSSNGKVYFFNNKTNASQWERPKEWSSSRSVEVKKDKPRSTNPHKGPSKHSNEASGTSGSNSQHSGSRQQKSYSQNSEARKIQQRHRPNHDGDHKDRDYRTISSNSSAKDRDYRDIDYRDANSSRSNESQTSSAPGQRHDRDYRSSQHDNKSNMYRQSSVPNSRNNYSVRELNGKTLTNDTHGSVRRAESVNDHRRVDYNEVLRNPHSKEEGSNGSSTTTPKDTAKRDWQGVKKGSVESNESHESPPVANGDEDPSSTSALVQTLSNVLNQAGSSTDATADSSIEGNLKSALQMLLDAAVKNQHISNSKDTSEAKSDEPPTKRKRTTSTVLDEHIDKSTLVLQNASKVLTSLKTCFEDHCVLHVQGWPGDQMERQSNRLSDENHLYTVNHTSDLSATAKISRSQVRAAEIHSTLHEQRVLYLRQQIKDLEKSTTFVPFT